MVRPRENRRDIRGGKRDIGGAKPGVPATGRAPTAKRLSVELDRAVRSARTSVAEYARALGMRDPEEIVKFTRYCVRRALGRSPSRSSASGLVKRSLDAAAAAVGINARRTQTASAIGVQKAAPAGDSADETTARSTPRTVSFVPRAKRRSMPRQPLGEMPALPDLGATTARWVKKSIQAIASAATPSQETEID
jgi:hypothetical protein